MQEIPNNGDEIVGDVVCNIRLGGICGHFRDIFKKKSPPAADSMVSTFWLQAIIMLFASRPVMPGEFTTQARDMEVSPTCDEACRLKGFRWTGDLMGGLREHYKRFTL